MARRFIEEMQLGDTIEDEVFVICQKDLRQAKNGSLFISLAVGDRTGRIPAKIWDATEGMYQSIPEGGFLRLRGRIEEYRGEPQLKVEAIRPVDPNSVNLADLLPHTQHDIEQMWQRLLEILRGIKNHDLLMLIKQFVTDEEFAEAFKRAPAAVSYHHAYIGGLLEHTLNLLEVAEVILPRYPQLNRDVVLAGLFLHDIGKAKELAYEAAFTYTDEGQLVGHIVQAAIWIEQKAAEAEKESGSPFPADLKHVLQHIVLAHHGAHEFGSPKLPATPEAAMVHFLDVMDAKMQAFAAAIEQDRDESRNWTDWIRSLETRVYKPDPAAE